MHISRAFYFFQYFRNLAVTSLSVLYQTIILVQSFETYNSNVSTLTIILLNPMEEKEEKKQFYLYFVYSLRRGESRVPLSTEHPPR